MPYARPTAGRCVADVDTGRLRRWRLGWRIPHDATGGESTTTSVQPTTTASPEAESGPLVGLGELELVESTIAFLELEGPQWMPDDGVLLFSDVSANTIYQVGADDESRSSGSRAITPTASPSTHKGG